MKKIKEEKQMKKQNKRIEIRNEKIKMERGITILALVITIIVLLILAGITINAITGDNGLIGNAGIAKEEAEIANEKEILEEATVSSMGKDKYGNLKQETLQEELSDNDVEVTQSGNNFICKFPSEREYIVNQDGDITEKKGLLASEISAENYGNYVKNYSDIDVADGGESQKSDWQIYYTGKVGNESEEHIYLISSNYISVESIPASKNNHTLNKGSYPYSVEVTNILGDYPNGSDDVAEETRYLNGQYYEYLTYNKTRSTNDNMKAVAYMCDTNVWNKFKTNKADFTIGGPTIELLFKSYNKKYGTNYLAGSLERNEDSKDSNGNTIESISKVGYSISDNGGESWSIAYTYGIINTNDNTYVLRSGNANGVFLASPSGTTGQSSSLLRVNINGQISPDGPGSVMQGIRPIVCLKADVQLEKVDDGYRIVE